VFVCVYRSRGRLNAYKASLIYSFGDHRGTVLDIRSYAIQQRLKMRVTQHLHFLQTLPRSTMKHGTPSGHDPMNTRKPPQPRTPVERPRHIHSAQVALAPRPECAIPLAALASPEPILPSTQPGNLAPSEHRTVAAGF
jgi:hypothetical protein